MARTKISEFSATPANNTDIDSINIAEGCAPSGINDAIRELMAQLKDFQTGAVGDSFNGPIGSTSAVTGAFTTLSATGAITSTLATGTAPFVIASTTKVANLNADLLDGADWAAPAALGSTTPAAVSATTLSASSTVSGTGFSTYLASPPAIGGTAAAAGSFTTLSATGAVTVFNSSTNTLSLQKGDGAASILFGSNTAANGRITSIASGGLFFSTGDITQTEKMRITADGNVGVGTSSPAAKLDIIGTARITSSSSGALSFNAGTDTVNTKFGILFYTPTYSGGIAAIRAERVGAADAGQLLFYTAPNGDLPTLRATLDSSGNLGLGVTPSAWSGIGKTLQINTGGAISADTANTYFSSNSYYNGTNWIYQTTNNATRYTMATNSHLWYVAASGTAGNAITFTQAMTLNASGNLNLGLTSEDTHKFQAGADNPTRGIIARLYNFGGSPRTGTQINFTQAGVADWTIGQPANTNAFAFWYGRNQSTDGTEAARFDSSGNLGIGTTSPAVSNYRSLVMDSSVACVYMQRVSGTEEFTIYSDAGITALSTVTNPLTFSTNGSERARIDTSGNLLIGKTSTSNNGNGSQIYPAGTIGLGHPSGTGSGAAYALFGYDGTGIGSITQSGTTAVLYNTTSDQRLKENIADADSASTLIDALQVRKFDWKADGSHQRYGFVAQELVTVAPEAVHQPEDTEEMMAVDYSKLVPMLVKEIQSLRARVAQLESN